MRVLGLVRHGAIINLLAYYVIVSLIFVTYCKATATYISHLSIQGLPIGAFLCFKRDMGLKGLWIGLSTGITFAGIATAALLLRVDWHATVTLVRKKLGLSNVVPGQGEADEAEAVKGYGTMGGGH
jgi:Na+-driven multidrug efflux pump